MALTVISDNLLIENTEIAFCVRQSTPPVHVDRHPVPPPPAVDYADRPFGHEWHGTMRKHSL